MVVTRILKQFLFMVVALVVAAPAAADVKVTFHSREFGATFPHAFVSLKGTLDATGEAIDTGYGFTAKTISPAILMGSVGGQLQVESPAYIENSQRHFTITVDDEGYRAVMAVVDKWREAKQPSYNLNRANCVHFVGEMAQAVGLDVTFDPKLMKKPRSFLVSVKSANEARVEPPLGLDGTQAAAP